MKFIFTLFTFLTFSFALFAQNPNYDEALAKKLNADDYGMKSYILVILKSGTNKTSNKALVDSCFAGHMVNINHMVDIGKLVVAGPIAKNEDNFRGIFILNTSDMEEAKELLKADPAILSNILDVDMYKWFGSAALPEYLEASDKIWKAKP